MTTSYPLIRGSTSGVFIEQLVRHLSSHLETIVITPASTQPIPTSNRAGYELRCFRYAPRRWQLLAHQPGGIPTAITTHKILLFLLPVFLFSMFVNCLRTSRRVDLIHANWSINGVVAGLAGLLTKTPVITTLRGSDVARARRHRADRFMLRLCGRLSRKAVTVSNSLLQTVSTEFPSLAHKLTVVPNGVDARFLGVPGKRPITNGAVLHLTTVGNLVPGKGTDNIIKALSRLEGRDDIDLTIIGEGPEKQRLQALTDSLGLASRVRFAGAVPPASLPASLATTDIFVTASYSEGRPNSVLEAMAAGIPVIGTDIDGINEIVRHEISGLLFPAGDTDQLAWQIARLHDHAGLRLQYGEAGRKYIIDNGLTWEVTVERYLDIYQAVVTTGAKNR